MTIQSAIIRYAIPFVIVFIIRQALGLSFLPLIITGIVVFGLSDIIYRKFFAKR